MCYRDKLHILWLCVIEINFVWLCDIDMQRATCEFQETFQLLVKSYNDTREIGRWDATLSFDDHQETDGSKTGTPNIRGSKAGNSEGYHSARVRCRREVAKPSDSGLCSNSFSVNIIE